MGPQRKPASLGPQCGQTLHTQSLHAGCRLHLRTIFVCVCVCSVPRLAVGCCVGSLGMLGSSMRLRASSFAILPQVLVELSSGFRRRPQRVGCEACPSQVFGAIVFACSGIGWFGLSVMLIRLGLIWFPGMGRCSRPPIVPRAWGVSRSGCKSAAHAADSAWRFARCRRLRFDSMGYSGMPWASPERTWRRWLFQRSRRPCMSWLWQGTAYWCILAHATDQLLSGFPGSPYDVGSVLPLFISGWIADRPLRVSCVYVFCISMLYLVYKFSISCRSGRFRGCSRHTGL